jgi:hypothetical protein
MSRISRFAIVAAVAAALAAGTLPIAAEAAVHAPDTARPSLTGTWNVQGGIFKFAKNSKGQFVDTVLKQRPGVACPNVNDKNGQIVLTQQKKNPLEYKGTWKWFNTGTCAGIGNGPTSITLSASGKTAVLLSYPPPAYGDSAGKFTIKRVS